MTIENKISNYLESQSRNKIVFYKDYTFDFETIDIGNQLSQSIYYWNGESKLPMKVLLELDVILNSAITNHDIYRRIISISNIGILLEPDLKQDLRAILEKYSNNNTLFVKWEGEIDNENLYFLSKEKGIKINIKNLSHIAI